MCYMYFRFLLHILLGCVNGFSLLVHDETDCIMGRKAWRDVFHALVFLSIT